MRFKTLISTIIVAVVTNLVLDCVSAQNQNLQVGVTIVNGQNQVNQIATYRFTLITQNLFFPAGTIIQTTFPNAINLTLNSAGQVDICSRYIKQTSTSDNLTCTYDQGLRQLTFVIEQDTYFDIAYEYDVGRFTNPSYSTLITGFDIQIQDSNSQVLSESGFDATIVQISPGNIFNNSLEYSSSKVSDPCIYTFQFAITNDITPGGFIQIGFPSPQIIVPAQTSNIVSIQIYGQSWQTPSQISSTSSQLIIGGTFSQGLIADSSQKIEIKLQNIVNPGSLQETQSFQISTLNSAQQTIDQVSTGMTVKPTIPGVIGVKSFYPSPYTVGQAASVYFNLQLPQVYSSGYLLITLPPEIKMLSLTCQILIGFFQQNSDCQLVSSNQQQVRVNNQPSSLQIYFAVGSVSNPQNNQTTSSFQVQSFDAQNYLQSQILTGLNYTPSPGIISQATVIRAKTQIGASTDNSITISFLTMNSLINGQQILLKMPTQQVQLLNNNTAGIQCLTGASSNNMQGTICTASADLTYIQLALQAPCSQGCPANTQIIVQVTGIQNPQWKALQALTTVEIYTMTSNFAYTIDQVKNGLYITPDLVEGPLNSMAIQQSGSHFVGSQTSYSFKFTIGDNIPQNGYIRLYFPNNAAFAPSTGSLQCTDANNQSTTLTCQASLNQGSSSKNSVNYVQITGSCINGCPVQTSFQLSISNLINPSSTKNVTNNFAIRTFTTQGYYIDLGNSTNALNLYLVPSTFSLLALTSPSEPIITGALASYNIQITPKNSIDQYYGKILIIFPPEIQISQGTSCSATASNQVLNCQIDSTNNTATITNPNNNILGGTVINFGTQAINPLTTKRSSAFSIQSFYLDPNNNANQFIVDSDLSSVTVQADTPNSLKNVTVIRNNSEVDNNSDFYISFTTTNPMPNGSTILISLPSDQILTQESQDIEFFAINEDNSTGLLIQKQSQSALNNQNTYINITLLEWCSSTGQNGTQLEQCPPGIQLKMKITNVMNPPTTKPPSDSYKIVTQTFDGFQIDAITQNVFASPFLSAGPFLGTYIDQSIDYVGSITTLKISIKINDDIPKIEGSIRAILPPSLYYQVDSSPLNSGDIQCTTEGQPTNCSYQTQETSMGLYISQLTVNLNCSSKPCVKGSNRTVEITNIRNKFNTASLADSSSSIQLATLDGEGYTINAQAIVISQTNLPPQLIPNNNATIGSVYLTNHTAGAITSIQLNMKTATRLQSNSFIQISLPTDQFTLQQPSIVSCSDYQGRSIQCSSTLNSSFYYISYQNSSISPDNGSLSLQISGFSNRYNTLQSMSSSLLATFTPNMDAVDQSKDDFIIMTNLTESIIQNLNFNLTDTIVGQKTELQISFKAFNGILAGDQIIVSFSNGVLVQSGEENCLMTIGGETTLIQSDQCNVQSSFQSLQVTAFMITVPIIIQRDQQVTFSLTNATNLLSISPLTTNISVQIQTSPSILISQGNLNISNMGILQPNQFRAVSFTRVDSPKLQMKTDVDVKITVPIQIQPGAKFVIQIPTTQFVNSNGIQCLTQNSPLDCSIVQSNDLSAINITTADSFCSRLPSCDPQDYTFTLQGFSNPDQLSPIIQSIKLWMFTTNDSLILDSSQLFIYANPPLQVGDLLNAQIMQPGSLVTGTLTQYIFSFKLPIGIANSSQLILTFPNMTLVPDINPLALINTALNQTYSRPNITMNGPYITQIVLTRYCQLSSCDNSTLQQMSLTNVRNVEFVRPRNQQFQIQMTTNTGFVLSQNNYSEIGLPPFIQNQLTEVSVTRASQQLSAANVNLMINFTTPNRIPDGSYILLSVPFEQVTFPNYKSISCFDSKLTSQIVNCTFISNDGSQILYNISEWCVGDCSANSSLSLVIRDTTNPSQLAANYPSNYFSIMIYTQDGYLIETSPGNVMALPVLSGIPINNIQLSRQYNVVGKDDFLTFVIPISTMINVSTDLVLNFTQGQFLRPSDQQLPSTYSQCEFTLENVQRSIQCAYIFYDDSTSSNVNNQYGIQSIQSITMPNVCSQDTQCESGLNITIIIKIRNWLTPLEINQNPISLTFKATNSDLGMGIATYSLDQLQPNSLDVQLTNQAQSCNLTGAVCLLEMLITTSNPVPSDSQSSGLLIVQVPQQMVIRASECTAYLMDMMISCLVNNPQQLTVRYQISPIALSQIQVSYVYRIIIQDLENPYSTEPSDSFIIYSQVSFNNQVYLIDSLQTNLSFRVSNIGQFNKAQVIRSNTQLGALIDLTFTLQNNNQIPNNGSLFISIPSSQVIRQNYSNQGCDIQTSSNKQMECTFIDNTTIKVDGICGDSDQGCGQDQSIQFTLGGSLYKNPVYQKDPIDNLTDSVEIYSAFQNNGVWYKIDQTYQGLFISPQIAIQKLVLSSLLVTSSKTSEYMDLTFIAIKDEQGAIFDNNYLRLKFDPALLNYNIKHTIYASINSQTSTVASIQQENGNYGSITYLTLLCADLCLGSQSLTIQIFGIQNPYFIVNDNSLAGSQLYLQELQNLPDQVLSQGSLSLQVPFISYLQLAPITQAQVYSYNPNTTQENTLDIQFAMANDPFIPQGALINFQLPSAFANSQQASQIVCSNIFTSEVYQCNYYSNNSIVVEGYYTNYDSPNSVVALKINGLINPSQAITNGVINVSINYLDQLFAQDDKQLQLSVGSVSPSFCLGSSQCSHCFQGGACAQCTVPSNYPLQQGGNCVYQCTAGYFESDMKCYKCAEGCQECSSFDQCSKCDPSRKFIDGSCDQAMQCPSGTNLDTVGNQCTKTIGCDPLCTVCGVSPSYCYSCSEGKSTMDGSCIGQCPSSFYQSKTNSCLKCDSLCAECSGGPTQCTACRKGLFEQSILDLGINSCVQTCSNFSTPRKSDPLNFCDPCSQQCLTCSGEPNYCTSCYYDKKSKEDLFYVQSKSQCVSSCPVGSQENYSMHTCETSSYKFAAFPPLYLLLSALFLALIVILNKIVTRSGSSKNSDVALAFLTVIEFLNRVFLLANLWFSTKSFSFCVTGVDILANSFLGIYFVTLVVQPIVKQIQAIETQSYIFSFVLVISQLSGVNTIRLITSQFMGQIPLSNRYTDIVYYVKQLEQLSILSSLLCIFQLFVGMSCLFDFGPARDAFGFGINAIIFNLGLIVLQTQKYYQSLSTTKVYQQVQRRPQ